MCIRDSISPARLQVLAYMNKPRSHCFYLEQTSGYGILLLSAPVFSRRPANKSVPTGPLIYRPVCRSALIPSQNTVALSEVP